MRYNELIKENESMNSNEFASMMEKFLGIAMDILKIKKIPKITIKNHLESINGQPSFGMYDIDKNELQVALADRHPIDILRTISHELTHFKQHIKNELNNESGKTGSPEENEANYMAGIIMREFSKQYPEYMKLKPFDF